MMKSLFLLLLFISCIPIYAINKYIAKTGNDSNTGTINAPFLTIQRGLEEAHSGDTVFVKTGTYQESIKFSKSGTLGHPIVLKCYRNEIVTVDAQNTRAYCIYETEKNYLTVDGINLTGSNNYALRLYGGSNITIKNVSISLPVSDTYGTSLSKAISIAGTSSYWLTDITFDNVHTLGGNYGLITGSKVARINILGGVYSSASIDGISLAYNPVADTTIMPRNIIVNGAEVCYNLRQGIVTWGLIKSNFKNFRSHHNAATGIQIENLSSNILIEDFLCENNSLAGGFETGVWIDDSDSVTVRRGIMRSNQCGFRVSNSNNVLAYNLLIYSNNYFKAPPNVNNSSGINFYTKPLGITNNLYVSHVELYNSVIYNNSNNYSQRGSVVLQGLGTYILKNNIIALDQSTYDIYRTGSNITISDYNLMYNIRELNIYYNPYTTPISSKQMKWNKYKSATGQEAHSINADPLFIDPKNGNFGLLPTSPAIKTGINVGLRSNYLGYPINIIPNIGGY